MFDNFKGWRFEDPLKNVTADDKLKKEVSDPMEICLENMSLPMKKNFYENFTIF